jgi:hypothetical protein
MHPIERQFLSRGLKPHGILFLPPSVALEMVDVCRQQGVGVLGVDGFRLSAAGRQPLMEHSIDLSGLHPDQDGWQVAAEFLDGYVASDLWFEVVLDTSD